MLLLLLDSDAGQEVIGVHPNLEVCQRAAERHAAERGVEELEWSEDWYAWGVSHQHAGWDGDTGNYFIDEVSQLEG